MLLYTVITTSLSTPRDGSQIETYNLGGNLKYPTGIYIDGEGNRFIASNGSDYVHIADSKGHTDMFKKC